VLILLTRRCRARSAGDSQQWLTRQLRHARRPEIIENLHRGELSKLERAEHVAAYARLIQEEAAQLGQVSSGGRGRKGGDAEVGRRVGISRQEIQRAKLIAAMSDAAKSEARAAGLDDNQEALLQLAKAQTRSERVAAVEKIKAVSRDGKQQKERRKSNNTLCSPRPGRRRPPPCGRNFGGSQSRRCGAHQRRPLEQHAAAATCLLNQICSTGAASRVAVPNSAPQHKAAVHPSIGSALDGVPDAALGNQAGGILPCKRPSGRVRELERSRIG
jgi:hypothetical protein